MLQLSNATSEWQLKRNQLIKESLRPSDLQYSVENEYPIVLSDLSGLYSYILSDNDEVIAHANMWPRKVLTSSGKELFDIGLVGNVATSKSCRGKGYMRELMSQLELKAKEIGMTALVLWSDLTEFYSKLGYKHLGQEYRFYFCYEDLIRGIKRVSRDIQIINAGEIEKSNLENMLKRRCPAPLTLRRTVDEFERLLTIPDVKIFSSKQNAFENYFVIGKGYDMNGVIHEWGCESPMKLVTSILSIMEKLNVPQLTLLAPSSLNTSWLQHLSDYCSLREIHPMAHYKPIGGVDVSREIHKMFIWGLDSI